MCILGIDIAKATFTVTLLKDEGQPKQKTFDNTEKGFNKLSRWLGRQGVSSLHACMEATNIYWEALADYLYEQEHSVSVVNPQRIKGFAQSQLRRSKTDKIDSLVIAQFCQQSHPRLWQPPTPQQRRLRALERHRQTLKKRIQQFANQLDTCTEPTVRASLTSILETLKAEKTQIEQEMDALVNADDDLKRKQARLMSIKGVGKTTAQSLLAEMYDLEQYESARAATADAGLVPRQHQSGSSVNYRPKMSKMGKAAVRGALYMPAITAMTHNPIIKNLKARLEKAGKHKKAIIGAAMRKLLHLAYGVLKNDTDFDPQYAA